MNLPVPKEADEGRTLVAYLRLKGYRFTHITNETGSGKGARFQGIRNKQQGQSKGFPDYLIWVGKRMVAIELKRVKGSATSPEQKEWIAFLQSTGITAEICKGAEESINLIERIATDEK